MNLLTRRRASGEDGGFALLSVILTTLILFMLGSVLFAEGITALPQAKHKQDFDAALAAAEAGVDDYLARLNENYDYSSQLDANLALSSFVPVAPSSASSFTYRVDTSALGVNGSVALAVTGRTGKVSRTVRIGLRPYGFLDALSQTDYNLVDPALFPVLGSVAETTRQCAFHAWEANPATGGTGPASGCGGLLNYWVTGNVLDGPMQSNDDFYLYGTPRFNDTVDSGDPYPTRAPYWLKPYGATPTFAGGAPRGQRLITSPPNSSQFAAKTTVGVVGAGCLYTGPTSIRINGTTMSVVSPGTKSTNPGCLGTGVALPANRTIYVQDIPGAGDPNYSASCAITVTWSGDDCHKGDAFVDGTLADQLTIAAANNIIITGNVTYDSFVTTPRRALGLIATNSVVINHPVASGGSCGSLPTRSGYCNVTGTVPFVGVNYTVPLVNPTVNAAILSLQHSFAVMNFDKGPSAGLGDVRLKGTVAGRFMDIEGTFDSSNGSLTNGYNVDYVYDTRMRNGGLVPPNFLDPAKTFWHRVSFTDCSNGSSVATC